MFATKKKTIKNLVNNPFIDSWSYITIYVRGYLLVLFSTLHHTNTIDADWYLLTLIYIAHIQVQVSEFNASFIKRISEFYVIYLFTMPPIFFYRLVFSSGFVRVLCYIDSGGQIDLNCY